LTDVTIISERGPWKEEAGLLHGLTARQDKMRVHALLVPLRPQGLIIVPGKPLTAKKANLFVPNNSHCLPMVASGEKPRRIEPSRALRRTSEIMNQLFGLLRSRVLGHQEVKN
jgi:hypothetical protein